MAYTTKQLADLAGISVRTLHYYDQTGLLKPARLKQNDYRYYEDDDLLKLQQILFFRELDFPIKEIKRILFAPDFDMRTALKDQKRLIGLKIDRLDRLIKTINRTINKVNNTTTMDDKELYGNFSKEEMDRYTEEARQRWGHTEAFKQSQERVRLMGKEGLSRVLAESGKLTEEIASCMKAGKEPSGDEAQKLIARHYDGLRAFYEPSLQIYRGLAEMYVADERFKTTYEKIANGLAQFMSQAMIAYCDKLERKK